MKIARDISNGSMGGGRRRNNQGHTYHRTRFMDFHDLRTEETGNRVFVELHLSVDNSISIKEAHYFTEHLPEELKQELPTVSI